nr:F-box only protein 9-like isoform X1 [Danaus plexippus plexippus]
MASVSNTGGGAGSGSGSDCDGDEQEDPSSSKQTVSETKLLLERVNLDDGKNNIEDELEVFRQQWQRELESSPYKGGQASVKSEQIRKEPLTDEEQAKKLFLLGVEFERNGKLYEAIQHYKRAIQILPDVESRLYEETDGRPDPPEGGSESEMEEVSRVENNEDTDDEDVIEGEDLLSRLQRIMAKKGYLVEMAHPAKGGHISWLPYEVIQLVLRWVVGAELDGASLERVAAVCRGLYVAAREPDIWRCLCVKTWGIECGTPRVHGYPTWRQMYIERARLNLNGVYISKTTYVRHGENNFQDQFYRPWYLVDYYRYLRFFPEGLVLMWTTADEPASCVGHLKHRDTKNSLGILSGHYRLVGDTVAIVIKKACEKRVSQASTRYRSRRKEVVEQQEQIFHLDLELGSVRSRRNSKLVWRRYLATTGRDHWTSFDLLPNKFPPFTFSRVRAFTADTAAPLMGTT